MPDHLTPALDPEKTRRWKGRPFRGPVGPSPLPTLAEAERDLIRRALEHCKANKSQAARILGISRSHLRYRMMLHNLP
jgi:DNA-binding NtrC family response regulator